MDPGDTVVRHREGCVHRIGDIFDRSWWTSSMRTANRLMHIGRPWRCRVVFTQRVSRILAVVGHA